MAENEDNKRDFKGVWIPKEVWLDTRLNALDKIILTEIDSLDNGEKGCYASNKYIAEFCQCSETKVSTAISKLIKIGYLYVQKFDGRQRELKSRLSNFERQDLKICNSDIKNLKENNINNNTNNNKKRKKETSYDEIINSKINNDEIKYLIYEFIKMRKLKKKPLTDRALTIQINKLNKLSTDIEEQKAIIEKTIVKNWDEFYPIRKENNYDQHERPNATDYSEFDR